MRNSRNHIFLFNSDGSEFAVRVLGIVSNNITYRGYKASGCDLIVHQNLLEHLGMDTRIQRIVISSGNWGGQDLKIGLQEMRKSASSRSMRSRPLETVSEICML